MPRESNVFTVMVWVALTAAVAGRFRPIVAVEVGVAVLVRLLTWMACRLVKLVGSGLLGSAMPFLSTS